MTGLKHLTTMDAGLSPRTNLFKGRLQLDRPRTAEARREDAVLLRLTEEPVNPTLTPAQRTALRAEVRTGWREEAACASADPEAWFPEPAGVPVAAVTSTCVGCPVNRSCLAVAMLWREDGIWAATGPVDRERGYGLLKAGVPVSVVLDRLLDRPREATGRRRLTPFRPTGQAGDADATGDAA
jgi:Transcription factor WhiB